jgi:cell fate (sporulation/competence/biofilm development) regulator YlbF (YheA/YmcA/DUF963 family)
MARTTKNLGQQMAHAELREATTFKRLMRALKAYESAKRDLARIGKRIDKLQMTINFGEPANHGTH